MAIDPFQQTKENGFAVVKLFLWVRKPKRHFRRCEKSHFGSAGSVNANPVAPL
jgi:hypothetical protein